MGALSCNKGKAGEREFANLLKSLSIEARRGRQYCGLPESPDVIGPDGLYIEVKRRKRITIQAHLAEARATAGGLAVPVLAHRRDREDWMVTIYAADLVKFARRILAATEREAQGGS